MTISSKGFGFSWCSMIRIDAMTRSISHFRLTLLVRPSPPAKAVGSTCLKPPDDFLLSFDFGRGDGDLSSITSTISSSCGTGLLISSMMTVSLLLSLLGGLLGGGVRSCSLVLLTSITSLAVLTVSECLLDDGDRGGDLCRLSE